MYKNFGDGRNTYRDIMKQLPPAGTTPFVAIADIEIAVNIVCEPRTSLLQYFVAGALALALRQVFDNIMGDCCQQN